MAYKDAIEDIASVKKKDRYAEYAHLYEMEKHLEEVQNLDIEEIIHKVCDKSREIQFGRKVAHVNSRALMQDAKHAINERKVNTHLQQESLYLQTASVVLQVGAASFGPGMFATAMGAFAQGCSSSAEHFNKIANSQQEMLNHSYQSQGDLSNDHNRGKESAESGHEKDSSAIDRMIQNSRRQAELVMGS